MERTKMTLFEDKNDPLKKVKFVQREPQNGKKLHIFVNLLHF